MRNVVFFLRCSNGFFCRCNRCVIAIKGGFHLFLRGKDFVVGVSHGVVLVVAGTVVGLIEFVIEGSECFFAGERTVFLGDGGDVIERIQRYWATWLANLGQVEIAHSGVEGLYTLVELCARLAVTEPVGGFGFGEGIVGIMDFLCSGGYVLRGCDAQEYLFFFVGGNFRVCRGDVVGHRCGVGDGNGGGGAGQQDGCGNSRCQESVTTFHEMNFP